jgi:ParB family transcriptional regulator, chromosome partitioning protein
VKDAWGKLLGHAGMEEGSEDEIQMILMELIEPNPYQPRKNFDPEKIEELAQSIKTYGLLQPIILRQYQRKYQLVAGERRQLACQKLGWTRIPALVREYSESGMAAIALIENLQRENLDFLEEAEGLDKLVREFGLTQEVLAQRLGKSQSTIANKLRILKLPDKVKTVLKDAGLSERHARALLKLPREDQQLLAVERIGGGDLNVKQTEDLVEALLAREGQGKAPSPKVVIRDLRIFLNTLRQAVKIIENAGLKPRVTEEDLGDVYEVRISLPKPRLTPPAPRQK